MNNRVLALVAAAAMLMLLAACGDDDDAATTSPSPSPTADEVVTTQPDLSSLPSDLTSSAFGVTTSLSAPAEFVVRGDASNALFLQRVGGASAPDAYLAFAIPTAVFNPETGREEPVPTDILAWLQSHAGVEVTQGPIEVTVGGATGQQIDVLGAGDAETLLFSASGPVGEPFRYALAPGEPARVIVVDVADKTVVITAGAFEAADFGAILPELEQMIESVEFP